MLLAALLLTLPAQPCNDTITCQKQAAERKERFARAVAAEPLTERLGVELLTTSVFIDRGRGLVYALTPSLVAFDLETGAVKWKHASTTGDTLWRAGKRLVVGSSSSKLPPTVTFLDPESPSKPTPCTLTLDAPKVAEDVALDVFDRDGQPYVSWRSSWSYRGGAAPSPEILRRRKDAVGCGIVRLDPSTCAITKVPAKPFFFEPASGCSLNSALYDFPAAAASMPPAASDASLAVKVEEKEEGRCTRLVTSTLEARDAKGTLKWKQPLAPKRLPMCPPP
jgi:hypothetical protein